MRAALANNKISSVAASAKISIISETWHRYGEKAAKSESGEEKRNGIVKRGVARSVKIMAASAAWQHVSIIAIKQRHRQAWQHLRRSSVMGRTAETC